MTGNLADSKNNRRIHGGRGSTGGWRAVLKVRGGGGTTTIVRPINQAFVWGGPRAHLQISDISDQVV